MSSQSRARKPPLGPEKRAVSALEKPLPPSIAPVIILSGSDYEMGYQYGQQVGQYLEIMKDQDWVRALERFSYSEVLHKLKAFQHCIKEYTPEAIKEMEGMADGATTIGYELSYTDVLLINCSFNILRLTPTATYPEGAEQEKLSPTPGKECSSWSAWGSTTTDGSLICGDSADGIFEYEVAIIAFPSDGNRYITVVDCGFLAQKTAMNNKGVFLGVSCGFPKRDIDYDYGVPFPCLSQHLLRYANSAAEAKDMCLSIPYDVTVIHLSDVNRNAFVVEKTASLEYVRKPRDFGEIDFIYSTNNFFADWGGKACLCDEFVEHAGWNSSRSSISRNLEMWNMFTNYHGKVDLNFAKMMWRFPGEQPTYPLEGWHPAICNLCNAWVGIALPDDGNKGVMYICTGPSARVAYPSSPECHFYQIAGTHSFYQLALTSSPAKVVSAAKDKAKAYIAEAYQKLMWLKYTDTRYTALNELFSLANAEYYEGNIAYNRGSLVSGDEALLYCSRAVSAYTRSQAHAEQLYNALVPPATSPSDLGLPEWFGKWGSWTTWKF